MFVARLTYHLIEDLERNWSTHSWFFGNGFRSLRQAQRWARLSAEKGEFINIRGMQTSYKDLFNALEYSPRRAKNIAFRLHPAGLRNGSEFMPGYVPVEYEGLGAISLSRYSDEELNWRTADALLIEMDKKGNFDFSGKGSGWFKAHQVIDYRQSSLDGWWILLIDKYA